jgi:DnaK suppressor protein
MAAAEKDPTKLSKKEIEEFRELLGTQQKELYDKSRQLLHQNQDPDNYESSGDEVDLATGEYEQAFEYRLRDREKFLLKKIGKALQRLDDGVYNECEECGGPIGVPRLKARPVATLCIECKEEQEQEEKGYQKRRSYNVDYDL